MIGAEAMRNALRIALESRSGLPCAKVNLDGGLELAHCGGEIAVGRRSHHLADFDQLFSLHD